MQTEVKKKMELVESLVGSQVWSRVRDQVDSQVWSQVRSQVWWQVRNNMWTPVRGQAVGRPIREIIENEYEKKG